jgi:hypothetical protein
VYGLLWSTLSKSSLPCLLVLLSVIVKLSETVMAVKEKPLFLYYMSWYYSMDMWPHVGDRFLIDFLPIFQYIL